ncbi:M10 family metallopeptidase [Acuticoccus sediminis]|uniref:M10 family metallopeptidase n=1 Tax=Acuticoccus sediminis TaxID=2184697 RepID=UPI001CFEA262|nr:M10 family metallopeptidase [Acuticoccus sediminis]
MAGTATPTNGPSSGNTWLSGLLSGVQWSSGGSPTTISVYIAGTSGDETLTHGAQSITAQDSITQAEIDAMNEAMSMIADVCNITFTAVASQADADLIWACVDNVDGQGALGWANFPGGAYSSIHGDYQSVITVNQDAYVGPAIEVGGYDYITFIHELGHALGLAHPHDNAGLSSIFPSVSGPFGDYGDYDMNQGVYTMMSYNDGWQTAPAGSSYYADLGWEGTPMALDIAALQLMYGANMTTATGDDTYTLSGSNVAGTYYSCIWDAGGTDEIVGAASVANLIDLRAATLGDEVGGGGFVSYANGVFGGFTIANGVVIENATGGSLDDAIIGNGAANVLSGLGGADSVAGDAGADTLLGGAGADTLDGGADGDSISGGADNDTLVGDAGDDVLDGGSGTDTFTFEGVFGNDTLSGAADLGETANVISFGSLVTEAMITTALAANNDDLLVTVAGGSGGTTQSGTILLAGWATAQAGGAGFGSIVWTAGGGGSIDLTTDLFAADPDPTPDPAPDPTPAPIIGGRGSDALIGTTSSEVINSGAGNDVASALGGDDTLVGYSGNDTLYGGAGDDSVTGDQNNDRLYGEDGNDTLDGGAGYDLCEGGDGDDLILGGTFNDTLDGGAGSDTVDGGVGTDRILGGADGDSLSGGRDNDIVDGENGDDLLFGDDGRDQLLGSGGGDTLDGGRDNDRLDGGEGDDVLLGGVGLDTLTGAAGDDTLDGGAHKDIYMFSGDFGHDTIVSMLHGDQINLGTFRAVKGGAIKMADLLLTTSGSDVVIEFDFDRNLVADTVDLDGDAVADSVSITLQDTVIAEVTASDFIM